MTIEPTGRSEFVKVNGLRLHLLCYGESGPTLIIVPGITSPALTAEFVAMELARDHRVAVLDVRGRGRSDVAPSGGYTLDHYAEDLAGVIAAFGDENPTVLGHSMGARIAAAYAARHGGGPVLLADPPLSGPGRGPYPTSWESFKTQLDEARRGTTADEVRRFYPKWSERELLIRAQELPTCDETAVFETHRGFETEDFLPYWRQIRPPALLIRGAESPVVTAEGEAELRRENPEIPVVSVPEAGHMIPWDNFAGFMASVRAFLESSTTTGQR
ncbi:alpha/beta hydrolase [Mycolicibacterium agri]|uniref:Alpha/beta hydrolase n=1 Tax=Mycolicibacterium agri TaxID=36811 RepID=A0A2A7MNN2_MYCAG|nr:alpha/beta hydrolase [Mycolicibacterium agri]PEG33189.1 alpha/beta hydrolase [Mycolicibacterium agri]GFG51090.1 alpha/beta hydrolase [Mycolicibacterium agri]